MHPRERTPPQQIPASLTLTGSSYLIGTLLHAWSCTHHLTGTEDDGWEATVSFRLRVDPSGETRVMHVSEEADGAFGRCIDAVVQLIDAADSDDMRLEIVRVDRHPGDDT